MVRIKRLPLGEDIGSPLLTDLDDNESFDDNEGSVSRKFEAAQRELVTQSVDFGILDLSNRVTSGQIATDPQYQRRLRWDSSRQSRLIESFLMNVPIPPLFLAEEDYGRYSVIDGKQRLIALSDFFSNQLTLQGMIVFPELNGKTFDQVPNTLRSIMTMRPTLRCIIILKQSDPEIKFEVFERLNTGGVRLNAQEIRNSAYRGNLNTLILKLSEDEEYRRILRIKDPKASVIVQYMRDCELILRFFALNDTWSNFSGPMKLWLNDYMRHFRNPGKGFLAAKSEEFTSTLSLVNEAFGENAFLRWDAKKGKWSRNVLAALFDAQMIACYKKDIGTLANSQGEIIAELKQLFEDDDEFQDSVTGQTTNSVKVKYRIRKIQQIINKHSR